MAIPKILQQMRNSAQMNTDNEGSFIIRDNDNSGVTVLNDEALLIQSDDAAEVLFDPTDGGAVLLNAKPKQNGSLGEYTQFRIQGPSQYGELFYETNSNYLSLSSSWQNPNDSSVVQMSSGDSYQGVWANNSDYTEWMSLDPQYGLSIANNNGEVYMYPSSEGPVIGSEHDSILMQTQDQRLAFKDEDGAQYNLTSGTPELDQDVATKAYVDNNGGIFWATSETTFDELWDAWNMGKLLCIPPRENGFDIAYTYICDGILNYESAGSRVFVFCPASTFPDMVGGGYQLWCYENSGWISEPSILTRGGMATVYAPLKRYPGSNATSLSASDAYYRPIYTSTQEPTASDGKIGDIWIVYTE